MVWSFDQKVYLFEMIYSPIYLFIYFCFLIFTPFFYQGYTVEQKRIVFFKFVELFHDQNFPQELKAKVLFPINLVS